MVESYNAAESVECAKLKAILDINKGISQRSIDGTPRLVDGKPVSAVMTMVTWPDDALKVLLEARNDYLTSLAGPNSPNEKTDAQKDFATVLNALTKYGASIQSSPTGSRRFSLPPPLPIRRILIELDVKRG